jgi:predicted transcriptional regulator
MADKEPRWTVRGIDPDLQRRIKECAEAKRYTVGEVVTAALEAWLEAPQGIAQSQSTVALEELAKSLAEIQARLEALERQAGVRKPSLHGQT